MAVTIKIKTEADVKALERYQKEIDDSRKKIISSSKSVGDLTAGMGRLDRQQRALNKLTGEGTSRFDKMRTSVTGLTQGMMSTAGVAVAAGYVGWKFLRMAEDGLVAEARLRSIAESMGVFGDRSDEVTERISRLADVQGRLTGIDDDVIRQAQAKLLTFKLLAVTADKAGGAFDRTTKVLLDLQAAGFGPADSMAIQLGKALQDPAKGMAALTKSGALTKDQMKAIGEEFARTGDIAKAQTAILEALETQVGGVAEATARGSDKMVVSFNQAAGAAAELAVEGLHLDDAMDQWARRAGEIADGDLEDTLKDMVFPARSLISAYKGLTSEAKPATAASKGLAAATGEQADATGDAAAETDKLVRSMKGQMVAQDDLSGRVRTLTELELSAKEAKIGVREAERGVAEALKKSGKSSDDYKTAQIGLERAKLRSADATVDLKMKEEELGTTAKKLSKDIRASRAEIAKAAEYAAMGIAQGLSAKQAEVRAASRMLVDKGITGNIRKLLQVRSPSKVTYKLGQHTGDGYALGILSTKKKIESATEKVTSRALAAVEKYRDKVAALKDRKLDVLGTWGIGEEVETESMSGTQILKGAASQQGALAKFIADIKRSKAKGLSQEVIASMLAAGPQASGGQAAGFAGMSSADIASYNTLYRNSSRLSGELATMELGKPKTPSVTIAAGAVKMTINVAGNANERQIERAVERALRSLVRRAALKGAN